MPARKKATSKKKSVAAPQPAELTPAVEPAVSPDSSQLASTPAPTAPTDQIASSAPTAPAVAPTEAKKPTKRATKAKPKTTTDPAPKTKPPTSASDEKVDLKTAPPIRPNPLTAPGPVPAKSSNDPTPPPPPAPLVVTTYNQDQVKRAIVLMSVTIVIGVGALGWIFRDTWRMWYQTAQDGNGLPWVNLQPETIDQERLAAIPEANQASTPAQSTASPNLQPDYYNQDWSKLTTPELFLAVEAAQASLKAARINDHKSIEGLVIQAQQAQRESNETLTRSKLLNALQLAKELTMVNEYYKKQ